MRKGFLIGLIIGLAYIGFEVGQNWPKIKNNVIEIIQTSKKTTKLRRGETPSQVAKRLRFDDWKELEVLMWEGPYLVWKKCGALNKRQIHALPKGTKIRMPEEGIKKKHVYAKVPHKEIYKKVQLRYKYGEIPKNMETLYFDIIDEAGIKRDDISLTFSADYHFMGYDEEGMLNGKKHAGPVMCYVKISSGSKYRPKNCRKVEVGINNYDIYQKWDLYESEHARITVFYEWSVKIFRGEEKYTEWGSKFYFSPTEDVIAFTSITFRIKVEQGEFG